MFHVKHGEKVLENPAPDFPFTRSCGTIADVSKTRAARVLPWENWTVEHRLRHIPPQVW